MSACITRDREPQLAAGAGLTVSLQHVSISGYLLGAVIEPPSNAQHWITAESQVGAAAVWRRNPVGEVSIMPPSSLLEKERNRYYLVLVSHETGFLCEFVERRGKSSLKGEGLGHPPTKMSHLTKIVIGLLTKSWHRLAGSDEEQQRKCNKSP